MELQINIEFEQFIKLAKQLSHTQWIKLKGEVEKEKTGANQVSDLETFLLSAPTFTKRQFNEIAKTRKAITQWRTK